MYRVRFVAPSVILGLMMVVGSPVLANPCVSGNADANPITVENCLPGAPSSEWDISGAGDTSIQGFATDISVNRGETVHFKIDTDASEYHIDIYRLGYYDGNGARKVVSNLVPTASLPQTQPSCLTNTTTGLVDCGNWTESASWAVPAGATSGIYIAKLTRNDTSGASHIVFVVRDDAGASDILFQTSDSTWQAYNGYGGNSLYVGSTSYPSGHAVKVSYNRPFTTRGGGGGGGAEDWVFNAEYPMVRWLERNGYSVSYFTNVDSERRGAELLEHKVFLSVGHDEYWSAGQRANVEAARAAGVHLVFFSGNEVYWKTRWENSIDGSGTPLRTLVCYKEGTLGENQCGTKCDPLPDVWTGLWRDGCPPTYAPNDGCRPENALTGQISWVGSTGALVIPESGPLGPAGPTGSYTNHFVWQNTSVALLQPGQSVTLPGGTMGYEWNPYQAAYQSFYPANLAWISTTTLGQTHHLSYYEHTAGVNVSKVFGAGTVQWSWGLDGNHDRGASTESDDMQQATVNILGEMGAQGLTLQPTLVPYVPCAPDCTGRVCGNDGCGGSCGVCVPGSTVCDTNGQCVPCTPACVGRECGDDGCGATCGTCSNAETCEVVAGQCEALPCPCSLWDSLTVPADVTHGDSNPIEVGVRFSSAADGYITGIRFYKTPANTGLHVGSLWTENGTLLGSVNFVGETASGWQEAQFAAPIPVVAGTRYIASFHSTTGQYALTEYYFQASSRMSHPLTAPQDGFEGGGANGVYIYSGSSAFPTQTWHSANYWVDVVFDVTANDLQPPTLLARSPQPAASGVAVGTTVTATFNEPVQEASIVFVLRDPSTNPVVATVTYNPGTRTATLTPAAPLAPATSYGVEVSGVQDFAGNAMAVPQTWSFTTAAPPGPGPDEGPGGPILVVATSANPFTRYFAEILRNEGLNYFTVTDIQNVDATVLASYRTVVLGQMALSGAQVSMFTDWVTGGGRLVAMRPDKQLAVLLGLTDEGTTLANAYLLIDTSAQPGAGLVGQTIQFHGTADRYTLNGATALATLYSDASTATTSPAVTVRMVGAGRAAAFTYDLAWSVVTTRQGNPLWAGDERDGRAPLRSDDMFYGAKSGDVQPDWIDLGKVAIPQADEQQRLLAKLVQHMDAMPLPRFWYLPKMKKAAVVMTGDHHGCCGATRTRFQTYETESPIGCSLVDWECIRASSYVYINGDMSDAEAVLWTNKGFELGIHLDTGCGNYTATGVDTLFTNQLAAFSAQLPSLPRQDSHRTHCIAWSGYTLKPEAELAHGIRLDVNYYFWPPEWVANRPGMFTGSGMPMRFAQLDGTMIDVYQAATQMTDESGQNLAYTIDTLLDRAVGPEQYYGVFTANMHTDYPSHAGSDAIVASAKARGIPVVSGRQMLEWLDGRNASRFGDLVWDGNTLSFSVTAGAGARNLRGMVPRISSVGALTGITRGGTPIAYTTETIKGVEYAVFDATTGAYGSTYALDTTPPVISNVAAAPGFGGTAVVTWDTSTEASDSRVDYGTDPGSLTVALTDAALVTSHSLTLTGLLPNTVYYYRVTSKDSFNNAATYPVPPATLSFTTPSAAFQETTAADFAAGTTGTCSYISETSDGEVILQPTVGAEFSGTALDAGWSSAVWNSPSTVTVGGGQLQVSGARAYTDASFSPGRSLEFVATFTAGTYQNIGFTGDATFGAPWVVVGIGGNPGAVYARSSLGVDYSLGVTPGTPHKFRIEWNGSPANNFVFYVNDNPIPAATIALAASSMVVQVSDFTADAFPLSVNWLRMSPYPASCSYLSSVQDSGALANWGTMSWTGETPVGTSLAMYARLGNTPVPDGTWTGWMLVPSSGSTIGGQSQYLQYRADLVTTNGDATPALRDVTVGYSLGADATPPTIVGRSPAVGATGVDAGTNVVVQFSEPMNATTINDATITLRAVGAGSDVRAVVTSSGVTATLDPAGLLASEQEYQVTVSGNVQDLAGNTLGADDTWTFTVFLDAVPPTISSIVAIPGAGGTTADITWTTDEAATSRVDYGTSPGSLTLNAENLTPVLSHGLPLSGLLPSTTYYYRVTSADGLSNSATSPVPPATLSFTTAAGDCFADRVVADFTAGAPDANTAVSTAGDGAVTLKPALDESFDGTALPAGWSTYSWNGGSSATVAGGSLTVDGLRANPEPFTAGPGSSLEFVATFAGDALQHVGFGGGNQSTVPVVFNSYPWAMFSTGMSGGTMLARVVTAAGPEINTVIPGSWFGAPHTFRIDWDVTEFRFWIDGVLRHTQVTPISNPMRPAVSDYTTGAGALVVDWMRLSSYPAIGTFASRIFDAGVNSSWGAATWTATLPAGTSLAISTRRGDTPTPDGTWTAFTPVPSSGSVVGGSSRYIQYSATLATTNPQVTPALEDLGIACTATPPDLTPPVISSVAASPGVNGTTATVTWTTDEAANSRVDYGTSPGSLTLNAENPTLTLSHSVPLSGLVPGTTYYYRVTSQDASSNSATSPEPPATLTFTTPTPAAPCPTDVTAADFALGTPDANTAVSSTVGDGAVVLRRPVDEEFSGTALPSGWLSGAWGGGGSVVVGGGQITVDGWHADPPQDFFAGATMEFVATFQAAQYQHVGFYSGATFTTYILIGTSVTTNTIFARATGTPTEGITIGGAELIGTPHLYRIEWKASSVDYYVDGVLKATQPLAHAGPLKASISDYNSGSPTLSVDWLRLTPYLSPGTFLSRVFDQGGQTSWGALSYTVTTPAGTSVSTSVRIGNTPTPDGSWTAFVPVSNGGNVGGGSRYVQYRAVLASSDPAATPALQDVAIACTPGGDVTPPVISSIVATPGAGGTTADITWNTDEPASSRVDYGTSPGALSLNSASSTLVSSHTLSLSSLTPSTVYYYRVTSVDFSGNSATSPTPPATLSFVTAAPPPPVCAQDQTAADFGSGTLTNTIVTQVADGEVTLAPTLQQDFDGTSLPSGWQAAAWGGGSTPTVNGGVLTLNGGHAATTGTFGSGSSIEFVATFRGEVNQHIGFTADFDFNAPWALFSTMSSTSGLFARVNSPGGSSDILIPNSSSLIGSAHRYRIDWKAASFEFYVDGALVSTIPRTISTNMVVHGSDLPGGPLTLTLDWIRATPYLTPGTFDSRIHDGGAAVSWKDITWTSTLPALTSASISVRTGNTATPDGTWTAFAPIAASGNQVGQVGRYLQYRASLSTTDPGQTPALLDLSVRCGAPPECTVDANCDDGNSCTTDTCDGGFCSHAVKTNGTSCSDGNACNGLETCQAGSCTAGTPLDCNDGDACTTDTCAPATGCQHAAICTVSGTVYYYRDNTLSAGAGGEPSVKGVENVGIGASAAGPVLATTGGTGAYVIPGLHGNVTITSVKKYGTPRASDHRGAITSMDAARLAMAAVGNGSLSVNQKLAGDVTGNGTASALDASLVARFAVGLVDHFPVATTAASDWKFLKCGLSYPLDCVDPIYEFNPITPAETGKDLYAILYGDVTGNWPEVEALAAAEAGGGSSASKPAEPLSPLSTVLSMPDTAGGGPGSTVFVPISATPGDGILGLDMTIQYDPAVVSATSVTTAGIATGFGIAANLGTPGVILISMFATSSAMSGSGEIARIEFHVAGAPGASSALTFTRATINEGSISRTLDPGLFTVTCAGVANGTACNDGNACTTADHCSAGVCTGTAVTAPAEVAGVSFQIDRATIAWNASADVGAVYDVVRGHLGTLPVGPGGGDELCAANDLTTTTFTDNEPVSPGDGLWYLVRVANSCTNGTYGNDAPPVGPPAARVTNTCQ